ncbi:unnamed protein product, partial [Eretmochelys imbricata]
MGTAGRGRCSSRAAPRASGSAWPCSWHRTLGSASRSSPPCGTCRRGRSWSRRRARPWAGPSASGTWTSAARPRVAQCLGGIPERRVDVLVNNAGVGLIGPIESISIAEMKRVFETNFFGAVRMVQGRAARHEAAPERSHRGHEQCHGAAGHRVQRRLRRLQVRHGGFLREPGRAAAPVPHLRVPGGAGPGEHGLRAEADGGRVPLRVPRHRPRPRCATSRRCTCRPPARSSPPWARAPRTWPS